jgi:hypothetical protein
VTDPRAGQFDDRVRAEDASALWGADGTNVLLIEASYWFGL